MNNYKKYSKKCITIQRKIKWKDAQKMSNEEKTDKNFLHKLEQSHKKYILLKLFISQIITEMWEKRKSLDIQLDLWYISKMDSLDIENIDFIEWKITSTNIMWDWEKISFIDFWFWEWDELKQKIFNKIMQEDTYKRWLNLCESYWHKS